jgi:outer membrane protein assembly factor BamC
MRLERTAAGSEIFLSHRGMVEVFVNPNRQEQAQTIWTPRPNDPQLEAEFLSRMMVKLGAKEDAARTAAASPVNVGGTARARQIPDQPAATLQVDEGFDRAWRRVGLTLDRSGFTVEDRDRASGLYFVRYVDPKDLATTDPGLIAKMFNWVKPEPAQAPVRYRIAVKADGERTTVSVQNSQGGPENGAASQRIVALLVDDLK